MEIHNGVFQGQVRKKRYQVNVWWDYNDPRIEETWEIEYKQILECEFDRPPLKSGNLVHLHELDEIVEINDAIRSTGGGYIYNTNYVIEEIEDDETVNSKQKAEEKRNEIIEKLKIRKEQPQKEDESTKKKWYQFWK